MTEETETVSSAKRIAIIEALSSFSHPITLLFFSFHRPSHPPLSLSLFISSSSSYSVVRREYTCQDTLESRGSVRDGVHVGGWMRTMVCPYHLVRSFVELSEVLSTDRHVYQSGLRTCRDPFTSYISAVRARPRSRQRNNISRNLPRSNET